MLIVGEAALGCGRLESLRRGGPAALLLGGTAPREVCGFMEPQRRSEYGF